MTYDNEDRAVLYDNPGFCLDALMLRDLADLIEKVEDLAPDGDVVIRTTLPITDTKVSATIGWDGCGEFGLLKLEAF